jgi:ribonuclease R
MNTSKTLRPRVLSLLKSAEYRPANKSEISRTLEVDTNERGNLRRILHELEDKGTIRQLSKGRYILRGSKFDQPEKGNSNPKSKSNYVTGTIVFNAKGFAFVTPNGSKGGKDSGTDIFIPERDTFTALPGDTVEVQVRESAPAKFLKHIKDEKARKRMQSRQSGRVEGRVRSIIERKTSSVIGTFCRRGKFVYVQPDSPLLPQTLELDLNLHPLPEPPPKPGDKVVATLDKWTSPDVLPRGHIVRVLGPADAPGVDILSIFFKHGLPMEFPPEVIAEAAAIPEEPTAADFQNREDWRDRPVFTIDPHDAKDFDDAILVTPLANGSTELAVHIADVSHYVKPGTALDKEAKIRGNSVYLVDRVVPMLPEKLSNGVCSLKPNVDRLTRAAIIVFDRNGNISKVRFTPAIIHSQKRYSYEQAYEVMKTFLDPESPRPVGGDPFDGHLFDAWALASVLRKKRFANGSLDLEFPEVKVILDETGKPTELRRIEYDESHQMIEEFMLAANDAVARATKDAKKPSLYRIHEDPEPDRLLQYRELALSYGIQIGDLSNRKEVQKLLEKANGHRAEHAIKIGLLKSLKRAAYSSESVGHYGLAKVNYTHFTSPIRRYADLVVHRVLNKLTGHAKDPTPNIVALTAIAEHISSTERTAAEAEIESSRLKHLEYFDNLVKENEDKDNPPTFQAVIQEAKFNGLLVELSEFFIKGLIDVENFPYRNDKWYFESHRNQWTSIVPKTTYHAGDAITVRVARVDFERMWIHFAIVEDKNQAQSPSESKHRRPAKKRNRRK